ncbi:MAG: type II toxin-antitoxin system prevent-host-death family antitoxin [Flavobacteriales bacterium]|nr:type II toxin-antitoxin system prevent-host-death family antitoxin [Flavobacteriales bacterium]
MIAIPVTTLRDKLKSYLDRVTKSFEVIVVSRSADENDSVVILPPRRRTANCWSVHRRNEAWRCGHAGRVQRGSVTEASCGSSSAHPHGLTSAFGWMPT